MRLLCLLGVIAATLAMRGTATARQPGRVVVVEAVEGAPELAARDGEEGVCVTLRDDARPSEACGDPTRRDDRAAVTTYDGTALGGVVPATAARVELVFSDGTILRPALQPGSGYRGRLAGRVAFFVVAAPQRSFADGPGGSEDVEIRVFDAAGTLVGVHADPSATGRAIGPGPGLVVWSTVLSGNGRSVRCAAVTPGRRPAGQDLVCGPPDDPSPSVEVSCRPRWATVTALLAGTRARLELRTGGRRLVRSASVAVGDGLRLHRIAVPPRAALRSITIRPAGRRPVVHRLTLPPAREQCGYDSSP